MVGVGALPEFANYDPHVKLLARNILEKEAPMSSIGNAVEEGSYRRTQYRLALQFPLEISGRDEWGKSFVLVAQVCNVSSEGGCMTIKRDLAKGEKIHLLTPKGTHFVAKVRWSRSNGQAEQRYVGFDIIEGTQNVVPGDLQSSWFFME